MSVLDRGFRGRTRLILGALIALALLLFTAGLHTVLVHQLHRVAQTDLQTLGRKIQLSLNDGARERLRVLAVIGSAESLWSTGLQGPEIQDVVDRLGQASRHPSWIGVLDAEGRVRSAAGGRGQGLGLQGEPWFAPSLQGRGLGPVGTAAQTLLPPQAQGVASHRLAFATPILQHGRAVGVLVEIGDWDWADAAIRTVMPDLPAYAGIRLSLLDAEGQVRHALQIGPTLGASTRWLRHREAWLGADAPQGWSLLIEQPREQAHATAEHIGHWVLAGGLLCSLLLLALLWWGSARLAQPVEAIASAAQHIADGQLDTQVPQFEHGSSEVQTMSRSIGEMSERLLAAQRVLEEQVRRRTAELEEANAALARLAETDPLTGLLNRRGLAPRLEAALALAERRRGRLSVMMLDIDHFKQVNDRHGHAVGDQVLQNLGQWLDGRFRSSDLCARIGGEEFVVVLIDSPAAAADAVAASLVRDLATVPMPRVGHITISLGLADNRGPVRDAQALLAAADGALYAAKAAGRNRVVRAG